jgi:hypothetical protein
LLAAILGIYVLTHSACENAYSFIWFFDEKCMMVPDKQFVYVNMFSLGYFFYDAILLVWKLDMSEKFNKQTMMHHLVVISGLTCGTLAGYGYTGACTFIILCELSTIFVNYRSLYTMKEL